MRKHGSFRMAAGIFTFLSIFVFTTFTLAASLHLRTTTDKEIYGLGDEVNWTIHASRSLGDNNGIVTLEVSLDDNRSEAFNPALTIGIDPNEEFLDTAFGLAQGFEVKRKGTPELNSPRLRGIKASQFVKITDIPFDDEFHVFAKGVYEVTKTGSHVLNIFLDNSMYWINDIPGDYTMGEFTTGDNFPVQFNVVFEADVDGDMYINLGDCGQLGISWLVTDCNSVNDWCGRADVNRSGEVDPNDISFMAGQWLWCSNPDDPDCDPYLPE